MAWITKNSGSATVERRTEPYVTEQMAAEWEREIIPRFPTRHAACIPCLHELQEAYNWLPVQAMEELAAFLEIAPSQVFDTASFYEEFFTEPRGKHTVWVCQSIACELCGEKDLTEAVCQHLGVEPHETTDDGLITLMKVECLGSCGTAPVALIDEKLHENINIDNFKDRLDELA